MPEAARPLPRPTFRFAPSPNGRLHLGHALSALLSQRMAAAAGGRLLLRIEDIDPQRCRPEHEAGILADLAWLGVAFAEPPRRQSEHLAAHQAALAALDCRGLVYPCFCSRGDIVRAVEALEAEAGPARRDPEGAPVYPGICRGLSEAGRRERIARGESYVLRLDMPSAIAAVGGAPGWREVAADLDGATAVTADPAAWGDVVLARRDAPTSYHLAVVVDDADQGVTHVVRGRDLFAATAVHRLLQMLLRLPEPVYHHHGLVLGPDGRKLAKSSGSTALSCLRDQGWTPEQVARAVGLADPLAPASRASEQGEPDRDRADGQHRR